MDGAPPIGVCTIRDILVSKLTRSIVHERTNCSIDFVLTVFREILIVFLLKTKTVVKALLAIDTLAVLEMRGLRLAFQLMY